MAFASADTQAAWDFLAAAREEDDTDDSFAADSDMDRGEGENSDETDNTDDTDYTDPEEDDSEETPDESEPAASDPIDTAISDYQTVIAAQQAQLNHLLTVLNAEPEENYDDLTPEQKQPYEAAAARRNLDPAYLHFHAVEARRAERTIQAQSAVKAVGDYADNHPDAERYGEAFARMLATNPAARAQLQMSALLPVESIYEAGIAAIDGMYARLARQDSEKRIIAERKAAEAAAAIKAQTVEKAKRRARPEGAGAASPTSNTGNSSKADNPADRILKAANGNWYNSLFR